MVVEPLREVVYQKDFASKRYCFLAGDIGGTNSNFGIFEMRGTHPTLLLSLHAHSQEVTNFAHLTKSVMQYVYEKYGIMIVEACFGAAGIVNVQRDYVRPTNLALPLDAQEIIAYTGLEALIIINDFEAVGLGIDLLDPESIVPINAGAEKPRGQKACIGAGTGLGKAALLWNNHFHRICLFHLKAVMQIVLRKRYKSLPCLNIFIKQENIPVLFLGRIYYQEKVLRIFINF